MPKPDQNLRERLNRRTKKAMIESGKPVGRLTEAQKVPPSKRKSDNLKRRLNHRKSNQ